MESGELIGEILWIIIFLGIAFGVILGEKYKGKK